MLSLVTVSPVITAFQLLGIRLQDSAFLSEVAVNYLKKARGGIWPKRSDEETTHKKTYQDEDTKSAINEKKQKKKKQINSQTAKSVQVFLCNTTSIWYKPFVCSYLNGFKYFYSLFILSKWFQVKGTDTKVGIF